MMQIKFWQEDLKRIKIFSCARKETNCGRWQPVGVRVPVFVDTNQTVLSFRSVATKAPIPTLASSSWFVSIKEFQFPGV